jgi:hypothetical protein
VLDLVTNRLRSTNNEEEEEPQEKEDAYKYPYRLFRLQSVNATGDV